MACHVQRIRHGTQTNYCTEYCTKMFCYFFIQQVKDLFTSLKAPFQALELDKEGRNFESRFFQRCWTNVAWYVIQMKLFFLMSLYSFRSICSFDGFYFYQVIHHKGH